MYQIYIKHTDYKAERPWVIIDVPMKTLETAKICARHYDAVLRRPVKIVNLKTQGRNYKYLLIRKEIYYGKYVLITHYSYDLPIISGFYTYKQACELLFEDFTEKIRVEEEENMMTLETKIIDTPHSYAKIVDGNGEVTEWYVVNATHLNNVNLPE